MSTAILSKLYIEANEEQLRVIANAWSMEHPNCVINGNDSSANEDFKIWFEKKFNINSFEIMDHYEFVSTMNNMTLLNNLKFQMKRQKEIAKEGREDPRFKMLGEQIDEIRRENESLKRQLAELSAFFLGNACAKSKSSATHFDDETASKKQKMEE